MVKKVKNKNPNNNICVMLNTNAQRAYTLFWSDLVHIKYSNNCIHITQDHPNDNTANPIFFCLRAKKPIPKLTISPVKKDAKETGAFQHIFN